MARVAREYDDGAVPLTGRRIRAFSGPGKGFNENLNPLKRYLGRQIGRPWNKVFSEICETLDTGSTVKQHVRDHLQDLVALNLVRTDAGELRLVHDGGFYRADPRPWRQPYYVDPETGLLCDTRRYFRKRGIDLNTWRRKPRKPVRDRIIVSGDIELRRLGGIWYQIRFGEVEDAAGEPRPVASKRQLGRKELRKYGLMNAPGGE
jgi:hypothetical protein